MKKYILYAIGEIMLVVIGILIALQIDDWNDRRATLKLETEILQELKSGLNDDLKSLRGIIRVHNASLKSQNILVKWLTSNSQYHDSISVHFGQVARATFFNPQKSTFETLKQLGTRLIANDTLRNQILGTFDSYEYYNDVNDQYMELNVNMAKNINHKYFKTFRFGGKMTPVRVNLIKSTNEYSYHLHLVASMNRFFINRVIKATTTEVEKTIKMINDELERRKDT